MFPLAAIFSPRLVVVLLTMWLDRMAVAQVWPENCMMNLTYLTVDGRNSANQLIWQTSHYLQGFIHPRWLAGFLNHQQDEPKLHDFLDIQANTS